MFRSNQLTNIFASLVIPWGTIFSDKSQYFSFYPPIDTRVVICVVVGDTYQVTRQFSIIHAHDPPLHF